MKYKIMAVVVAALALAGCSGSAGRRALYPGVKTPENSKLFVRHVDPHSGVVSYLLRPGLIEDSHKQLYFTSRSMTEDGRFLVVDCACNEYSAFGVYRPKAERKFSGCKLAVIDLLTEKVYRLYDIPGQIPFLDVDNDELFYARFDSRDPDLNWLYKRELLKDPLKEVKVCRMPEELTKGARSVRYFCHLTLSHDRTLAFLDSRVDDNHVQGVLNVRTGEYTKWYDAGPKNIFHGQINPVRNDIALCCWECVPWTDSKGVVHDELVGWEKKHPGEPYPRLQLCEPGKLTMVPTQLTKYATHERWNEQGDGFYWCSGGVYHHDLATGVQTKVSPKGTHAFMSVDRKYVVSDCPVGGWWRGCAWQVYFHNRETDRGVYVFTCNEPLCPRENPSHLHPDPHPQFVCGDRYVISTVNHSDGHMDCAVTPVDQLVALTERRPVEDAAKSLRVLAIGNSYTQSLLPEFPRVAKAAGCALDLTVFAIGGKSLSNHWMNCEAALKDPSFRPYDVGGRKTNLPEVLSGKDWDVVTLQEQSADGMHPECFDPWADRIIAFVRQRLPKARICFQLTWSDTVASHRITANGVKGSLGLTQDEMYAALEKTYVSQARRLDAELIPVGKAVQIYRKELPVRLVKPTEEEIAALKVGEVPDLKGELSGWWQWGEGNPWDSDYGKFRLRQDFHHLNAEGRYLQACVWTATLFGVDLSSLGYAPDLGPDFVRRAPFIRACAMKAAHLPMR